LRHKLNFFHDAIWQFFLLVFPFLVIKIYYIISS
jgi:hypothetical protein